MSSWAEESVSSPDVDGSGAPRMAVVHEWIAARAGSEQVFEAIAQIYPNADLYALTHTPGVELEVGGRPITTTFLDSGRMRERRDLTLPMMPAAWRRLGRGDYDIVVSSHHAFAHANQLVREGGRHYSYVHTPARYVWSPEIDGRGTSPLLTPARAVLKRYDRRVSNRVDSYAANSSQVASRIHDYWGRDATVIHPPVRVEYFAAGATTQPRDYVLGMGRWIPYKNLDLVIKAADQAGLPAKIAGRGPDREKLEAVAAQASVPVEIIESPSDEELRALYQGAAVLVFPTNEDFGIVPVEAQAAGTPVVAPAVGGALDTVRDGVSGVLVEDLSVSALADGIRRAVVLNDAAAISAGVCDFALSSFQDKIRAWVQA